MTLDVEKEVAPSHDGMYACLSFLSAKFSQTFVGMLHVSQFKPTVACSHEDMQSSLLFSPGYRVTNAAAYTYNNHPTSRLPHRSPQHVGPSLLRLLPNGHVSTHPYNSRGLLSSGNRWFPSQKCDTATTLKPPAQNRSASDAVAPADSSAECGDEREHDRLLGSLLDSTTRARTCASQANLASLYKRHHPVPANAAEWHRIC